MDLSDTSLMIVRGQLSTLRRELHNQRKAAADIAATISNAALEANRRLNDGEPLAAKEALRTLPDQVVALSSLCDYSDALQAQMKPLHKQAWPTGRIDE